LGIETIERPLDRTELLIADEVFLCGTAAKIVPVKRLENYQLQETNPITQKLREKLIAITEGREPAYKDWVYPIAID
jgi:branched-chain amino acid aminotransferase